MKQSGRESQVAARVFCVIAVLVLSGTMPGATGMAGTDPGPRPVYQRTTSNGTISGIVTDDNGTPLAGIGVGTGDYDTIVGCGGADHWTGTAADGSFQLDVPPGTYLVFVNSHPYPSSYLPEAYSNINSWHVIAQTTPIDVTAGQVVTGIDFSLPSGFSLSGRLVDDHGQPVLGAGGHIENLNGTVEYGCALGFGSSGSDGTFRVNVPAGVYDLFFGTASEGHTVAYGLIITQTLDLGDVLFAEGSLPSGPRPLEPGYTADWFVAPGAFNMPQEIMLVPDGDLYVLAVRSQILYRLAAGGAITPVATGLAAYLGDVDAAGNVYLHGHPQGILHRVAPDGTKTVVVQSPELQAACDSGFGLGPDGNLYLARNRCADTSTLLRITPAGAITLLADGLPVIVALRTAPDGRFLAAADNRVYALSLSDYALTLLGQIPTCCIAPGGLAVDSSGNIYLSTGARTYGGKLYRVASSGQVTLLADIPLNGLSGLEWLAGTQEVVGGQLRQGAVLAVSTSGAIRELVPGNGLVSPMGTAFAPDGTLAVANDDGGMMARVSSQGDVAWFFDYISFTPPEPFVAYAPDGTLYASEGAPGFAGRIIHLPPGAAAPAPWIDVDWPSGLAREASGTLLVSETRAGRITRITQDLVTTTIATDLLFPQALALDAAGQLYAVTGKGSAELSDTFPVPSTGDTIVKIAPGGQAITLTQVLDAAALAVAPDGTLFTVAGSRVWRVTPQGEAWPFADGFWGAMGLAFDLEGNLYVSDAGLNGIARIRGFPRGAIQGTVSDAEGGQPLAGADLAVVTGLPIVLGAERTTAADGTYCLPAAPGTYTVTASALGYQSAFQQVTVQADVTVTVDLALMPWAATVYLPLIMRNAGTQR